MSLMDRDLVLRGRIVFLLLLLQYLLLFVNMANKGNCFEKKALEQVD